jgi:hypothetical protein
LASFCVGLVAKFSARVALALLLLLLLLLLGFIAPIR